MHVVVLAAAETMHASDTVSTRYLHHLQGCVEAALHYSSTPWAENPGLHS